MEFGPDIRGPQRLNPSDFGNPLTFPAKHHLIPHRADSVAVVS